MKKEKILRLFYLFLLVQPLIDLVTSIMTKFLGSTITLGLLVRGLIFLICCIYIIFFSKSKYRKISIIYLCIIFAFWILYFATKLDILSNKSWIITEATYIFKYFYTIIIFLGLLNFWDQYKPNNKRILNLLVIELFVYCFVILLANLTNTVFLTYAGGEGNSGWFYSGNETGIIVSMLFPILFYKMDQHNSFKSLIYVLFAILAIEIIGTKTSTIGLLLPTLIFVFYFLINIKRNNIKKFFMTIFVLCSICLTIFYFPVVNNIRNSVTRYERRQTQIKTNKKRSSKQNNSVEEYSKNVFISVILSDRDYYIKKTSKIYNNASTIDKLFGIGFVNRDKINDKNIEKLVEMDYHDVFYHYGLIGFIIFSLPFIVYTIYIIKILFRRKFKISIQQLIFCYMTYVGIFIATIVGHTFSAPAVSFYIILAMTAFINEFSDDELEDNKVTIFSLHLNNGGIEKYVSSLSKMLGDKYEIEIISTYKILDNPAFEFSDNVKIKYLINTYPKKDEFRNSIRNKKLIKIIKQGIQLLKLLILKTYKNIIEVQNCNSKYIITTRSFHNRIVGRYKNNGVIAIATEHNYHNNNNKYIKDLVESCTNIDYLVLVSEELKDFYSNKLKYTKCIYIPNVIDNIPPYNKKNNINYRLVSVGRLVEEKGYEDLIDIISIIKKDIPNIKLDIYGDGPLYERLFNKIEKLNLKDNINLMGFCNHEEILSKFKNYDLYLMTSLTESFGLVLLEAMSESLACIAFDSANGAKTLLASGNGILIENRDKKKYSKEVVILLNNMNKLNNISKKGYNSIFKYEIKKVKKEWLDLLNI